MKSKRPRWLRNLEVVGLLGLVITLAGQCYSNPDQLTGKLIHLTEGSRPFEADIEGVRYLGETGSVVDDLIFHFGAYEADVLHFLRDSLAETSGSDGVFLDIGANTGQHSLYMARFARQVHAVEPYPPVLERFRAMIELNGFENITIHPVGYSNAAGNFPFFAPPDHNIGLGTFAEELSGENHKIGDLPLVVGDDHLAEAGVGRIDMIKIDIEGYERYALLGLAETLARDRPIVVLELNASEGGFRSKEQLLETFSVDYEFWAFRAAHFGARFGSWRYVFGPGVHGRYTLNPFEFDFSEQINMAAIPVEKRPSFLE